VGPESTISLGRVKPSELEESPVEAEAEELSEPEAEELEEVVFLGPQPASMVTARAAHRRRDKLRFMVIHVLSGGTLPPVGKMWGCRR